MNKINYWVRLVVSLLFFSLLWIPTIQSQENKKNADKVIKVSDSTIKSLKATNAKMDSLIKKAKVQQATDTKKVIPKK